MYVLTSLGYGHNVGHVSHEDAALELEFGVLIPYFGPGGPCLVLFVFGLGGCNLLTAEQDALKEVDLVLQ